MRFALFLLIAFAAVGCRNRLEEQSSNLQAYLQDKPRMVVKIRHDILALKAYTIAGFIEENFNHKFEQNKGVAFGDYAAYQTRPIQLSLLDNNDGVTVFAQIPMAINLTLDANYNYTKGRIIAPTKVRNVTGVIHATFGLTIKLHIDDRTGEIHHTPSVEIIKGTFTSRNTSTGVTTIPEVTKAMRVRRPNGLIGRARLNIASRRSWDIKGNGSEVKIYRRAPLRTLIGNAIVAPRTAPGRILNEYNASYEIMYNETKTGGQKEIVARLKKDLPYVKDVVADYLVKPLRDFDFPYSQFHFANNENYMQLSVGDIPAPLPGGELKHGMELHISEDYINSLLAKFAKEGDVVDSKLLVNRLNKMPTIIRLPAVQQEIEAIGKQIDGVIASDNIKQLRYGKNPFFVKFEEGGGVTTKLNLVAVYLPKGTDRIAIKNKELKLNVQVTVKMDVEKTPFGVQLVMVDNERPVAITPAEKIEVQPVADGAVKIGNLLSGLFSSGREVRPASGKGAPKQPPKLDKEKEKTNTVRDKIDNTIRGEEKKFADLVRVDDMTIPSITFENLEIPEIYRSQNIFTKDGVMVVTWNKFNPKSQRFSSNPSERVHELVRPPSGKNKLANKAPSIPCECIESINMTTSVRYTECVLQNADTRRVLEKQRINPGQTKECYGRICEEMLALQKSCRRVYK